MFIGYLQINEKELIFHMKFLAILMDSQWKNNYLLPSRNLNVYFKTDISHLERFIWNQKEDQRILTTIRVEDGCV